MKSIIFEIIYGNELLVTLRPKTLQNRSWLKELKSRHLTIWDSDASYVNLQLASTKSNLWRRSYFYLALSFYIQFITKNLWNDKLSSISSDIILILIRFNVVSWIKRGNNEFELHVCEIIQDISWEWQYRVRHGQSLPPQHAGFLSDSYFCFKTQYEMDFKTALTEKDYLR